MNLEISVKQIIIVWTRKKYFEDVCYEWLQEKKSQINE